MRKLIVILCLTLMSSAALGQDDAAKEEVTRFIERYAKATLARDTAYILSVLADDYTYTTPSGDKETRSGSIAFLEQEKKSPTFKVNSFRSENFEVRIFGNTALVTSDWISSSSSPKAHAGDPPHEDRGRYTAVLVKDAGKWKMVHEHDSEKPHDKPTMEKQVAVLSRAYTDMIRRNDAAAIAKILADDYIVTDENGKRFTKEEDLATYRERAQTLKIEQAEYLDQKVRMITGSIAVDHSTIRFQGTRSGKPFDITERITTTWQFREGRWLIVADHFSFVKP